MCWFYFGKVFGFIRILLGYFRYMFGLFRSFQISILNINKLRICYTIYIYLRKTKKKKSNRKDASLLKSFGSPCNTNPSAYAHVRHYIFRIKPNTWNILQQSNIEKCSRTKANTLIYKKHNPVQNTLYKRKCWFLFGKCWILFGYCVFYDIFPCKKIINKIFPY